MFSTKSSKQAWTAQFLHWVETGKEMHRVLLKSSEMKSSIHFPHSQVTPRPREPLKFQCSVSNSSNLKNILVNQKIQKNQGALFPTSMVSQPPEPSQLPLLPLLSRGESIRHHVLCQGLPRFWEAKDKAFHGKEDFGRQLNSSTYTIPQWGLDPMGGEENRLGLELV